MATYRVGSAGATVLDAEGRRVYVLPPGYRVVPGTTQTARRQRLSSRKRLRDYADKAMRAGRDYLGAGAR